MLLTNDLNHFLVLVRGDSEGILQAKQLNAETVSEKFLVLPGYYDGVSTFDAIASDRDIRTFWAVSLLRIILQKDRSFHDLTQKYLAPHLMALLLSCDFHTDTAKWIPIFRENPETWMGALDAVDEVLEREDKWIVATYEGLEQLVREKSRTEDLLRTLLSFWMIQNQRWIRIKAKILLPEHLYGTTIVAFQDGAKISAYTIRI